MGHRDRHQPRTYKWSNLYLDALPLVDITADLWSRSPFARLLGRHSLFHALAQRRNA